MAPAILYEYLTEYHSSVLIKLDRGGQQSERAPQILFGFVFFHSRTIRAGCIRKLT